MRQRLQAQKGIRLSLDIVKRIERVITEDGSSLSQFMRTAAVNELKRREALLGKVVNA